jgi:hypothetical protein
MRPVLVTLVIFVVVFMALLAITGTSLGSVPQSAWLSLSLMLGSLLLVGRGVFRERNQGPAAGTMLGYAMVWVGIGAFIYLVWLFLKAMGWR